MRLLYFTNGGINGFDKFGHFLRANLDDHADRAPP